MRRVTVLLLLVTTFAAGTVQAQRRQPTRPPATTEIADAGPDYWVQGEYAGWRFAPGHGMEYTGLQVIALGDGKFDAVEYRGGLPGNGWDRATKSKLSGQTENDSTLLSSDTGRYVLASGTAIAQDTAGRELGRLIKMERRSPTMGMPPPSNAIALFDGRSTDQFEDRPAPKVTDDGLLVAGVLTKMPVAAFHMHLEFRTPYMPTARDQARGNSGVYIQRRYEVQILDSFGLDGAFNEAGSLYRQMPPDLNMAFPPLTWQTYDIWFTPPRFAEDGKTKTANARITVLHNGVPVHWHREITAKTGGGQQEGPQPLPIQLQDHGNPVMFRNIWIVPLQAGGYGHADGYRTSCCQPRGRIRCWHRRRCT
jgi:hypothetical protein